MAANKQNIHNAIEKFFKQEKDKITEAMLESAQYAVQEVKKDLVSMAEDEITRYYNTYQPSRYKRKKDLYKCITKYINKCEIKGDTIYVRSAISYDPNKLGDTHQYEPSAYYRGQQVEGKIEPKVHNPINEFIVNNFLEGIHPYTDGSREVNAAYMPQGKTGHITKPSPLKDFLSHANIENFHNDLVDQFSKYFFLSLWSNLDIIRK